MSAFIVEFATINRIATFIDQIDSNEPPLYLTKPYQLPEAKQIAEQMFAMNVAAVKHRYGDDTDLIPKTPFEFTPAIEDDDLDPYQVLKSLDCFLYQCYEGDEVPEMRLFRKLQKFSKELGYALAQESEAYAKAKWG
jgi:hypothetical protein